MFEKLILFDIDGTLLWSDGAGRSAIHQALERELGVLGPFDDVAFAGRTDPQIVRDLLRAVDHPLAESDEYVTRICERYTDLLEVELASPRRKVRAYEGVHELLGLLSDRGDGLVGLLTGNVRQGATLKLTAAGIDPGQFQVGAYGSDAFYRSDLPAIAAERSSRLMGHVPSGDEVVIIGDTPSDVTCGREIGARAIAVATGPFGPEELRAAGAYAVFQDLSSPLQVVEAIYA